MGPDNSRQVNVRWFAGASAVLLCHLAVAFGDDGCVVGYVIDARTNQPIKDAAVQVGGTEIEHTDSRGGFVIRLAPDNDPFALYAEAAGYRAVINRKSLARTGHITHVPDLSLQKTNEMSSADLLRWMTLAAAEGREIKSPQIKKALAASLLEARQLLAQGRIVTNTFSVAVSSTSWEQKCCFGPTGCGYSPMCCIVPTIKTEMQQRTFQHWEEPVNATTERIRAQRLALADALIREVLDSAAPQITASAH